MGPVQRGAIPLAFEYDGRVKRVLGIALGILLETLLFPTGGSRLLAQETLPETVASNAGQGAGDVTTAARAFQEGQRAQLQQDYARAAQLFELAHQAAPAPAALRSAIRNHEAAGNLTRAATLSLHGVSEYPNDVETASLTAGILERARQELAELDVACDSPCTLRVDGAVLDTNAATAFHFFVAPGQRVVTAAFPSGEASHSFAAEAGERSACALEAPAATSAAAEASPAEDTGVEEPAADPAADNADAHPFRRLPLRLERQPRHGLSPALTWVGLGATALLGSITVWSFADTYDASDRYEATPTQQNYDDGVSKWRRSWILGGATAAVALSTILIATLGTDWSDDEDASEASLELVPSIGLGHAGLQLQGAY